MVVQDLIAGMKPLATGQQFAPAIGGRARFAQGGAALGTG